MATECDDLSDILFTAADFDPLDIADFDADAASSAGSYEDSGSGSSSCPSSPLHNSVGITCGLTRVTSGMRRAPPCGEQQASP